MTGSLHVLCGPAAADGFRLAGVPVTLATSPSLAAEWIARLREEEGAAVVLIEAGLHRGLPAAILHRVEREGLPILVPFAAPPAAETPGAPDEGAEVVELLRRAVGYRVRLG